MRYVLLALLAALFSTATADTVLSRVDDALEAGTITSDQAVVILWNSIQDRSLLPVEFVEGTVDVPCGTPVMDRITFLLDDCSEPIRREMVDLARPSVGSPEYTYDTSDGHFKIHWTDNGVNATNLAWVQTIAEGFEYAWEQEINVLDWDAPPSDLGLGGDTRFDVYVMALEGGTIGWCSSSGEPPDPTTPEADYSSHIAMSNSESWGSVQIQSTCAHEFKHAVQNGYEAAEPSWFKENCATWMEYMVGYSTYIGYLHGGDNCLRRPWYDIRTMDEGLYEYGCTPWPMYMQYRCGGQEAVRMVWEECAAVIGNNLLQAIDSTAANYGLTFLDFLAEYDAWRWFTGSHADGDYYPYEESSQWTPGPFVFTPHNISSLPASGDEYVYPPEVYGMHWIRVDVADYQSWILFDFDGRDGFPWTVGVIQTDEDGNSAFQYHFVENSGSTLELAANAAGWDEVVFYVQPTYQTTLTMTYDFTITEMTGIGEGTPQGGDFTLTAGSNPMTSGQSITVGLPVAGFTTLDVYDLGGRMVQTILAEEMPAGQTSVSWNASSLSGGTYFVRLAGQGGGAVMKVVLVD